MAAPQSELCLEIHKHVNERLDAHDEHFKINDEELRALKESSIRTEVVVSNLCDKIADLVDTLKKDKTEQNARQTRWVHTVLGVAGTVILLLAGFLIWYIQSLPR